MLFTLCDNSFYFTYAKNLKKMLTHLFVSVNLELILGETLDPRLLGKIL